MRAVRVLPDGSWDYVGIGDRRAAAVLAYAMLQGARPVAVSSCAALADLGLVALCRAYDPGLHPAVLVRWDPALRRFAGLDEGDGEPSAEEIDALGALVASALAAGAPIRPAEDYVGPAEVGRANAMEQVSLALLRGAAPTGRSALAGRVDDGEKARG